MRHERDIRSGRLEGTATPDGERLSRQTLRSGPIGILPRLLDPAVAAELDALPVHRLPHFRLEGDLKSLRREVQLRLAEAGFGPNWLAEWLVDDLSFLGLMYEQLTAATRLCFRLDVVEDDACRKFHVDNVRYRLVTTYRGPGTEWLPPHGLANAPQGSPIPSAQIKQLDRGWVAIMRGAQGATADHPGVLHRSPPIDGAGIARLFLAINEAPRHS
jgi:hypothetical protein